MNILEGCGYVGRKSKGTYFWFGFNADNLNWSLHKEATSICMLSRQVKELLLNTNSYIDIKDICQHIVANQ